MSRSITAAILLILLVGRTVLVPADDPPPAKLKGEDESARAAIALEMTKAEAVRYRLELDGTDKSPVVLQPDSLLQWTNPVAGSIHGAVFVWTDRGCPVALASIYRFFAPNKHLGVELHSLTPTLRSASRDGVRLWSPGAAAPERKPIIGASKPADTPAGRLRQLRALASAYSATELTRENLNRDLRLLTQPIYRYASTDPDVIDGGLFAFVQGTDPEIILIIEARRTSSGPEWQFAAARMNSLTLQLNYKGAAVWSAPTIPWGQAQDHTQPYTLFMYN